MLVALAPLLFLFGLPWQEPDRPAEPPRIEWQRNLEDALAAQQATGLPLLVVANMDGETFNDRFAKSVYRDPAFIAATRGYICVIGSNDRHNERDYDASGQRIECPRFPGCTCSEHIDIEPELFRRWFDGKRTAPRHIGVAADGKILFDRFLDASMQTAIDAIVANQGKPKVSLDAAADLGALMARRDGLARRTLEGMYRRVEQLTARTARRRRDPGHAGGRGAGQGRHRQCPHRSRGRARAHPRTGGRAPAAGAPGRTRHRRPGHQATRGAPRDASGRAAPAVGGAVGQGRVRRWRPHQHRGRTRSL
jgi:hypothetical protein